MAPGLLIYSVSRTSDSAAPSIKELISGLTMLDAHELHGMIYMPC